jgi:hypothetical protein
MSVLVRATLFLAIIPLSACGIKHRPLADLVTAVSTPGTRTAAQTDGLIEEVRRYLTYLDSLRVQNATISLREQKKFDIMTVLDIGLGTTAAIYSFTSNDDSDKATVAGIAGAGSAFVSALLGKFRHGEDAEHARNCARGIERILATFEFPADPVEWQAQREAIAGELNEGDCFVPETR